MSDLARHKRLISWLALLMLCSAILLPVLVWASGSSVIDRQISGMHLTLSASARLVLPGFCATVRWDVRGAEQVMLNEDPVTPRGEWEVCPKTSTGYRLTAQREDGVQVRESVFVRVLFTTANTRLLGALVALYFAGAVLAVSFIGDLPILSPRLWQARRAGMKTGVAFVRWVRAHLRRTDIRHDIEHLTALAALTSLPLLFLRSISWEHPVLIAAIFVAGDVAVVIHWVRRAPPDVVMPLRARPGRLIAAGTLLAFTAALGFYIPMRDQFWMGGDEIRVLQDAIERWSSVPVFDQMQGRPLTPLVAILVGYLTPDNIFGFLWIAVALRFLSGVLVFGIVRLLLPHYLLLALAAGLLFVINPSEPTRFAAVHMQGYNGIVFLSLLGLYLYIRSAKTGHRPLLALACLVLLASVLVGEVVLPVALLWPPLLWLGARRHRLTWLYAWAVTFALATARVLQFQLSAEETYQRNLAATAFAPDVWIAQFFRQLGAITRYLTIYPASAQDWAFGIALGVIVAAGLIGFAWAGQAWQAPALSRRQIKAGLTLALAGIVLGFLPLVTLTGILGSLRMQFLSAPAQAVFLALVLAWIGQRFTVRTRTVWIAGTTGLLVTLATVSGLNAQAHRPVNPHARYEHAACIAHQVLEQVPAVRPDTVVLFVLDDGVDSPLGWNYFVFELARHLYGVEGYMLNYTDSLGIRYTLDRAEVADGAYLVPYPLDRYVAFRVQGDGTVHLLDELPPTILPAGADDSARYDPHARIIPGEARPLRYLHCPAEAAAP